MTWFLRDGQHGGNYKEVLDAYLERLDRIPRPRSKVKLITGRTDVYSASTLADFPRNLLFESRVEGSHRTASCVPLQCLRECLSGRKVVRSLTLH